MILIVFTTLYRKGGDKFARAAATLAAEKQSAFPDRKVVCTATESKGELVSIFNDIKRRGEEIDEFHFIGHAGMYGPMFRTTSMPEQFSPHEWRTLSIPFSKNAQAFFHACRSARWFAPFFARTFGVTAYGYHWYTTVSLKKERFSWIKLSPIATTEVEKIPVYIMGCPGRKSHGLLGSVGKYTGIRPVEEMKSFEPASIGSDASYDSIAELYDEVFADITVRRDECTWINRHLPKTMPKVLDIGCGNGALLRHLAPRITEGVGVDLSQGIIERATKRQADQANLTFTKIDGPTLPFADGSFDVVISMLSFRYLDWDPIMNEIRRVLKPGGKILVVDMVTAPVKLPELPLLISSILKTRSARVKQREFSKKLNNMVTDCRWQTMLKHNPIRAEHEMKWYLESRFPGSRTEKINLGWNARILAFDSGPIAPGTVAPQSYP